MVVNYQLHVLNAIIVGNDMVFKNSRQRKAVMARLGLFKVPMVNIDKDNNVKFEMSHYAKARTIGEAKKVALNLHPNFKIVDSGIKHLGYFRN